MDFTLSNEHLELRDVAQAFLDAEVNLAPLLVPGSKPGWASYDALWAKIAELGWPSLIIPESYGGLGMTYIDLAMIVGEMGRTLAPAPFFGTLAGTWAILKAGSEAQKSQWLSRVVAGECKLGLAVADADGCYPGAGVTAGLNAGSYRLNGAKSYVVDAHSADHLVVAAQLGDATRFFVVDRHAEGVVVEQLDWRDITRQVCLVDLKGAHAELLTNSDAQVWPWIRDRLYFALAAESAAGTHAVLMDAVGYAKERVAFGRPIGSFQAIKHQLAEIAGQAECATAAVHYAAWALTENDARAPLAAAIADSDEASHRFRPKPATCSD